MVGGRFPFARFETASGASMCSARDWLQHPAYRSPSLSVGIFMPHPKTGFQSNVGENVSNSNLFIPGLRKGGPFIPALPGSLWRSPFGA